MPNLTRKLRGEAQLLASCVGNSHSTGNVEGRATAQPSKTGRARVFVVMASWAGALGCTSATPQAEAAMPLAASSEHATATADGSRAPNDERGARLFDNFRAEKKIDATFQPDSSKTPELDGKGGPNADGTLNDAAGKPMPNTGHDYRLKNLFGWDLRGVEGIYGPGYHNKTFVTKWNLLTDTRSAAELRSWLAKGDTDIPAYGEILDERDLDDIVAFLIKTRARELARPDAIFHLDASAPKSYRLLEGADVQRGHERYAATCAECHGADGSALVIDEVHSAGAVSRTSGYEIWFKIQHGHPASPMLRQVSESDGASNSRAVLELLAALCDRSKYPPLAAQPDVPDGDARCGNYLK